MAHVIEMPKLSDTMEEGGIAHWLKKEGEAIKVGEGLVEIETDKATQEYESPEDGVVLKILIPPGKTVALRTPIAVIGEKGENVDISALLESKTQKLAVNNDIKVTTEPKAVAPKESAQPPTSNGTGRIKASPLARKKATEMGLSLQSLQGTGPGGRVVVRDLANAESAKSLSTSPEKSSYPKGSQSIPVTMMRKTIAKRLVSAKNEAPHFYLKVSANVTQILAFRTRLNRDGENQKLVKVSVNDIVVMAASRALARHPLVNGSWQGETILINHDVHMALAVALPNGLVTPVIRHSDRLGLREIAQKSQELTQKAKDGKLTNDDYQGGTFSVSNLGMFGIEEFTAIINPPQAAILAVGAALATPVVNKDGQVVVEQRLKLTLSCDHRVVDGATGAEFLKTLVGYLEDPLSILA